MTRSVWRRSWRSIWTPVSRPGAAFQDRLFGFALRMMGRSSGRRGERAGYVCSGVSRAGAVSDRAAAHVADQGLAVSHHAERGSQSGAASELCDGAGGWPRDATGWLTTRPSSPRQLRRRAERHDTLGVPAAQAAAAVPGSGGAATRPGAVLRRGGGRCWSRPVGTTKSDVHRGLRLLREALEREPLAGGRGGEHAKVVC